MFCPKCKDDVDPHIDTDTLDGKKVTKDTKAICITCKSNLPVTQFMLKSLYTTKKFFTPKPSRAFQYKCTPCKDFTDAVVKGDKAVCQVCEFPFNLSPHMVIALKLAKGKGITDPEADLREAAKSLESKNVRRP